MSIAVSQRPRLQPVHSSSHVGDLGVRVVSSVSHSPLAKRDRTEQNNGWSQPSHPRGQNSFHKWAKRQVGWVQQPAP